MYIMIKKGITVIMISLFLLLFSGAISAETANNDMEAWSCRICGAENILNYCRSCGAPREAHKSTFVLMSDNSFQSDENEGEVSGYILGNKAFSRDDVTEIVFQNEMQNIPASAWDVSESRNNSLMAWVKNGILTIAANGEIEAPEDSGYLFAGYHNVKKINFSGCFHTDNTINMTGMFCSCNMLQELDVSFFDTTKVTEMAYMFSHCAKLEQLNVKGFSTTNVSTMRGMFSHCHNLRELDTSSFDMGNVSDITDMFDGCSSLKDLDLLKPKYTSSERYLVDYVGESLLSIQENLGEPDNKGSFSANQYAWYYQDKGIEFLMSDWVEPKTIQTVVCHKTHYPIIGDLYGDSTLEEYLKFFEAEGYIDEPESALDKTTNDDLRYIDKNLHFVISLEHGGRNEPPNSITISEIIPSVYTDNWQVYYVKQVLTWLGYDPGPVDSFLNSKTVAAISAFQGDHGLEITGNSEGGFVDKLNHLWEKKRRYGDAEPWYSAYETQLTLLSDEYNNMRSYSLIYVDDDEIPELVINGNCEAEGCTVFTWHDGKMDYTKTDRLYYIYRHRKNIFSDSTGHMGYFRDFIYQIADGKWTRIAAGEYQFDYETHALSYKWNGEDVSEEEYTENVNKYLPEGEIMRAAVTYDYSEITKVLLDGGPKEEDKGQLVKTS